MTSPNSSPAAKLIAAIADSAGKVYPPAIESYGLDRRDRLGPRSNHPLWELALRIGQIFGGEFELYEHGLKEPMLSIELYEPAAIVMSSRIRQLSRTQQTFLLSYAVSLIAASRSRSVIIRLAPGSSWRWPPRLFRNSSRPQPALPLSVSTMKYPYSSLSNTSNRLI